MGQGWRGIAVIRPLSGSAPYVRLLTWAERGWFRHERKEKA